jgi:hypothetical protein
VISKCEEYALLNGLHNSLHLLLELTVDIRSGWLVHNLLHGLTYTGDLDVQTSKQVMLIFAERCTPGFRGDQKTFSR